MPHTTSGFYVGYGDWTQVFILGQQALYLSHLLAAQAFSDAYEVPNTKLDLGKHQYMPQALAFTNT